MGVMVSIRQESEILGDEWNASRISYGIAENPLSHYLYLKIMEFALLTSFLTANTMSTCFRWIKGIPWNDSRMEVHVDEFGELAWSLDPVDGFQKLYIFR